MKLSLRTQAFSKKFDIIQQRRADAERSRHEAEPRRRAEEFETKKERVGIRRLLQQRVKDWETALEIRAFIAAVEAGNGTRPGFDAWKCWALATADDLDPVKDRDLLELTVSDIEVPFPSENEPARMNCGGLGAESRFLAAGRAWIDCQIPSYEHEARLVVDVDAPRSQCSGPDRPRVIAFAFCPHDAGPNQV